MRISLEKIYQYEPVSESIPEPVLAKALIITILNKIQSSLIIYQQLQQIFKNFTNTFEGGSEHLLVSVLKIIFGFFGFFFQKQNLFETQEKNNINDSQIDTDSFNVGDYIAADVYQPDVMC
eukprot:TRINITY_DN19591_c0_g1_i4.p1 TRINITY_DN19591_c0_g1~~TRINITY_DN19591_c0_g1_i4.p1  ORF type:complete len:121 (-),score=4.01 TRINITY_DN19591_c0_g1_i4:66-428(-)